MALHDKLYKLRTDANLTQQKMAELLEVSPQAVQKWESGESRPSLDKLIRLSQHFGASLDALVLERDARTSEALFYQASVQPNWEKIPLWESYSANLLTEYRQCVEEGLQVEAYEELFRAVAKLPKGEAKERLSDVIFDIVKQARVREDYPYIEPSELSAIQALRKPYPIEARAKIRVLLSDRIHGAWMGRICGCLLGKTVEGMRTDELHRLLAESGNLPMHRYIRRTDVTEDMIKQFRYPIATRCFGDTVNGMPVDDDTNYMVLAQELVERFGREFTSDDIAAMWLRYQHKNAYCTAERVAFCNFVKGFVPPQSARYKNPYREWIGAQIRGDYFGYINPADPEAAAEMAYRDASISHTKNGIYGEMLIAAMIACAAVTDSIPDILRGGLAQIPATSRLYEKIEAVLADFEAGVNEAQCFAKIHKEFDEFNDHDWTHTVSNAMIVAASLLYGEGDFGRSIGLAVQTGFDTDCNGATVGSILGMRGGLGVIAPAWTEPVGDVLYTAIFGLDRVSIKERADMTLKHIRKEAIEALS